MDFVDDQKVITIIGGGGWVRGIFQQSVDSGIGVAFVSWVMVYAKGMEILDFDVGQLVVLHPFFCFGSKASVIGE